MAKVLLCPIKSAKQPYHLKSIDLRFFSLEELLYYYKNHEILVDRSIMEEEFVFWVKESLGQVTLSEHLHQLVAGKATLTMFISVLLEQVNTFLPEEKEEFLNKLSQLEDKDEFQKRKVLADQMLKREKYDSAIIEYHKMLKGYDGGILQEELIASTWHNLGCCYGRMLQLKQALECFKNAYSYRPNEQTKKAISFIMEAMEAQNMTLEPREDNFLHLLEQTDENKRKARFQKIEERMKDYLRST